MPSILALRSVLVISESAVFRSLIQLIFAHRADEVRAANNRMQGREHLRAVRTLDLVLCDVALADGDGFEVLRDANELSESNPDVILITTKPDPDEERQALEKGAIAYLSKPVSLRQLLAARKAGSRTETPRAPRVRPGGRACILRVGDDVDSPAAPQILWHARDISASGAFLETDSPIPLGSKVGMSLEIGGATIHVTATVERTQEPSWGRAAGIGVMFTDLEPADRETIEAYFGSPNTESY